MCKAAERLFASSRAPSDLYSWPCSERRDEKVPVAALSVSWLCIPKGSPFPSGRRVPVPGWLVSALTFEDISVGCSGQDWGN